MIHDARRNARNPEECGVLVQYAAMKKDECNAADRHFPTASWATLIIFFFNLHPILTKML
jgi:hypothetical protein